VGRGINLELNHTLHLDVDQGKLFTANLSQVKIMYQFNVLTFVRAIFEYTDITRDPALYAFPVAPETRELFTQFLFSYKINPQTVIFVGYSDNYLGFERIDLTQTDRTFFLKLGYAWLF
jgi:hypothetical protein